MPTADWSRVVAVFEEAAALPPGDRAAVVRARCGGDALLEAEVLRLLTADRQAAGFLEGGTAVAPVSTAAALPSSIGRYQVVARIGRGGFGDVFRAFDPVLKREVAIKACLLVDEDEKRRFLREAEIAARLHHPNVVTVFDFGSDAGTPYLVQELLSGRDLADLVAAGELPPLPVRLAWLAQLARGLAYAHSNGVVHRDIKPSNVRVVDSGAVKVLDFGIARFLAATTMTQAGALVGTVPYMAPEVLRGAAAEARSDVFAFGAVAWELLAGRSRLGGASGGSPIAQLYEAVTGVTPRLSSVAPDVPVTVTRLVDRCLASDARARPADGGEILAALAASSDAEAARPAAGWRPRVALAAALAVAVVLVLAWTFARSPAAPPASPPPAAMAAPPAAPALLRLDALPWAEIVEIVDRAGARLSLPAGPPTTAMTPMTLEVTAGEYTVRMRHPAFGESRSCVVRVAAGVRDGAVCTVRFARRSAAALLAQLRAES